MADFKLSVQGEGMTITGEQAKAITEFGAETGGTLEIHPAEGGAVHVVAPGGREFVYLPDGSAERPR